MINQNTFNDEKKLKRSKKIKLIMILSVLAVLFISYGLDLTNDKQQINNNLKVISYLENKYNQKFEIIQFQDEKYIKVNEAKTLYVFNENSTSGINIESYWRNLDD